MLSYRSYKSAVSVPESFTCNGVKQSCVQHGVALKRSAIMEEPMH